VFLVKCKADLIRLHLFLPNRRSSPIRRSLIASACVKQITLTVSSYFPAQKSGFLGRGAAPWQARSAGGGRRCVACSGTGEV
jgi:hypothetical protein